MGGSRVAGASRRRWRPQRGTIADRGAVGGRRRDASDAGEVGMAADKTERDGWLRPHRHRGQPWTSARSTRRIQLNTPLLRVMPRSGTGFATNALSVRRTGGHSLDRLHRTGPVGPGPRKDDMTPLSAFCPDTSIAGYSACMAASVRRGGRRVFHNSQSTRRTPALFVVLLACHPSVGTRTLSVLGKVGGQKRRTRGSWTGRHAHPPADRKLGCVIGRGDSALRGALRSRCRAPCVDGVPPPVSRR